MPGQQKCAVAPADKGKKQMEVTGGNNTKIQGQGEGRDGVKYRQGVKGQVNANRVKKKVALKGILPQVEQRVFKPPKVPGNSGIIAAVAG